jgi:hypothetical protein
VQAVEVGTPQQQVPELVVLGSREAAQEVVVLGTPEAVLVLALRTLG